MADVCNGSRVYLRTLIKNDISEEYIAWLNDRQVNQFLEVRHINVTYESQNYYVNECLNSSDTLLFGIFELIANRLVGSLKLKFADYASAELGILIGPAECLGVGIGTEVVGLASLICADLKINTITSGCYIENEASLRMFLKCGYKMKNDLVQINQPNGLPPRASYRFELILPEEGN